ncbi:Lipoxygenase 2 [Abeliophyllum distichum]|uniref:Lipoxygenase n=1 Tax=Abeliophyllum distichum TaxID=126358 RepID=A0ABD1Q2Y1_9LAMI
MLNQINISKSKPSHQILLPNYKPFIVGTGGNACFAVTPKFKSVRKFENIRVGQVSRTIKAAQTSNENSTTSTTSVVVKITVLKTLGEVLHVELVAANSDTGSKKPSVKGFVHKTDKYEEVDNKISYEFDLKIPNDFGEVGAIKVENLHHTKMFMENIVIDQKGLFGSPINITCNSWIHSNSDDKEPRIFFVDKSYLPSQTPSGLISYREKELQIVRGDGTGERKIFERIYDYDVYNDLGDPDSSDDLWRPVLGGKERPYPRRCRTGRARSKIDPLSESRSMNVYVPIDEAFSKVKLITFGTKTIWSFLHKLLPRIESSSDNDVGFPNFTAIDNLYSQGVQLPASTNKSTINLRDILPRLVKAYDRLQFDKPELIKRDTFSWLKDEEFARQTLAGLNPCCIQLVTELPLKSKLDPKVYGPAESAITKELIEQEIRGFTTLENALEQKKLFILDYHDLFLPYVTKVREIEGTTLYGSRTLFYLMPSGTLKPLAIELTRPPIDGKPQWKEVFQPSWEASDLWLWRLAKAHVLAHDSGYHQLVSHWLRTHCCVEPYIIATNRHLSAMHPIHRLLHPHLRYTMQINALARMHLINVDGIIEKSFFSHKYSIEISSVVYDKLWQFNLQALPADLINRGMAVKDSKAPHGLKLTIEDYPYANDGLLIWDAIKKWVTDYVTRYYPEANLVQSDNELQAWWTEIRTVGHGDKKDESWWPVLETPEDLIGILTNMIWVASGHHAAVNFGQYDFAGYFPNRPTIARTNMPTEDPNDSEKEEFLKRPEEFLLKCFPSQVQATLVMGILDVLSSHSQDEEYLGQTIQPYWKKDEYINAIFEQFSGRLKEIEGIIDARNADSSLKNRFGAGVVPYQLLKPFSEEGVTGMGVPNSISI